MKLICLIAIFASVANAADWWQSAIFYQIYPRSFKDSNNDGIGDIRGIIQKLDYLVETGVTATWLSPILKSPQVDYGYDISDFKQVDPMFGTNEELEELFREAKLRGIKIIMDFVPNHTSDQHEWFQKSIENDPVYKDWYVWSPGQTNPQEGGRNLPPNNWQAVFSTRAWTWNEQRGEYYLHQFASGQPDLNYRNPAVVEAMKDVLIYWMDRGADGFRIDAINHMFEDEDLRDEPLTGWTDDPNNYGYTHHIYTKDLDETYEMVQQWREMIDAYNVEKGGDTRVLFTEAYASIEDTVRYYADEQGNPRAHFPFNFLLIERLNENSNAYLFKNEIDVWMSQVPAGGTSNWVLGNHDKPRFGSRYGTERIDGLLTLLLTLPGVAVTYNGDEIGMLDYREISWEDTLDPQACNTNPEDYVWASRDPERTPFQWDGTAYAGFKDAVGAQPWLPVNPNYQTLNLALQKAAPKSFYKFYQQLATLRTNEVFVNGMFQSHAFNTEVFGYKRVYQGTSMVVLINFSGSEKTINVNELEVNYPSQSEVVLAGSKTSYNAGQRVSTETFTLRAYDAVVLKAASIEPTEAPTQAPTEGPTQGPTEAPTQGPTEGPTQGPTEGPTQGPTEGPTQGPTEGPTQGPTGAPTPAPAATTTTDGATSMVSSVMLLISSFILYCLF